MEDVSYEWMHPSWRDLVIEHLIHNTNERRHFISRCGVNGILLAISFAGGAEGLRKYPLLVDQEDWRLFQERVEKYLGSSELADDLAILSSINDSLEKLPDSDNEALVNMKELATNALLACREKWDFKNQVISSHLLGNYYLTSEFLRSLPSSPKLEATWNHSIDIHRFELDEYGDIQEFSGGVNEWAALVDIIRRNEPRFLRQELREETVASRLQKIVSQASQFLENFEENREITDEGDLDSCIHELDELGWCLKRLCDVFDSESEKIKSFEELIQQMEYMQVGLEEENAGIREEHNHELYEGRHRSSGIFNIDAVFSDL